MALHAAAPSSSSSTSSGGGASRNSFSGSRGSLSGRQRASMASGEAHKQAPVDAVAQRLIAQLEQLSLEVSVVLRHEGDVRYVLTVRHSRARALWKHPRSFDEYHVFQEKMLAALCHGHFCGAGCPWLENFLISYFPAKKRYFLGHTSKMLIERRKDALNHVLQTIRTFLLNRENHSCAIVKQDVAREFLNFVYGEVIDENHVLGTLTLPSNAVLDAKAVGSNTTRNSFASTGKVDDVDESDQMPRGSFIGPHSGDVALEMCTLCDLPMPVKNIYVMKMSCGHRFHDECILPKLNEDLRCPTCGKLDVIP
ncbi:hypothetical protein FI667_g10643, partial [Globisporangium splendens]